MKRDHFEAAAASPSLEVFGDNIDVRHLGGDSAILMQPIT